MLNTDDLKQASKELVELAGEGLPSDVMPHIAASLGIEDPNPMMKTAVYTYGARLGEAYMTGVMHTLLALRAKGVRVP